MPSTTLISRSTVSKLATPDQSVQSHCGRTDEHVLQTFGLKRTQDPDQLVAIHGEHATGFIRVSPLRDVAGKRRRVFQMIGGLRAVMVYRRGAGDVATMAFMMGRMIHPSLDCDVA